MLVTAQVLGGPAAVGLLRHLEGVVDRLHVAGVGVQESLASQVKILLEVFMISKLLLDK